MTKKLPTPVQTYVVHVDPADPTEVEEANAVLNAMFNAQADPRPRLAKLLEETRALLPPHLRDDRYWLPCTLIFHAVLPAFIPGFFNFQQDKIDIPRFNGEIDGLSHGEDVLVGLAFHLYKDSNPLPADGLTNLRVLDKFHFELAMLAIRLSHDFSTSPARMLGALKGEIL
jgi:hypothetical protein